MNKKNKLCAIIPVYNHSSTLPGVVAELQKTIPEIILIDDGCNSECKNAINKLAKENKQIWAKTHSKNLGKGAAVKTGLLTAAKKGFTHALQIDADGQHNLQNLQKILKASEEKPNDLILTYPRYDASIPVLRFYARYLTHFWVWVHTLSLTIKDTMCGFRIYPVTGSCKLLDSCMSNRMDFETEFVVRWYWSGATISQFETLVIYPQDGISHFLPWRDNFLITCMHTRLFFGMLLRLPLILRKQKK